MLLNDNYKKNVYVAEIGLRKKIFKIGFFCTLHISVTGYLTFYFAPNDDFADLKTGFSILI